MNLKLEKIYKNWAIHNFVGHPLMQLFYMINMNQAAKNIHEIKTLAWSAIYKKILISTT